VPAKAGISPESLSRFERGRLPELGTRKLLALLAVLGMELDVVSHRQAGMLDELRVERARAQR
jgi:transcriptional regulator with XRE-family HTH domain